MKSSTRVDILIRPGFRRQQQIQRHEMYTINLQLAPACHFEGTPLTVEDGVPGLSVMSVYILYH